MRRGGCKGEGGYDTFGAVLEEERGGRRQSGNVGINVFSFAGGT